MKSAFRLLLASALTISAGSLSAEAASSPSLDQAARRLLACVRTGAQMPRCMPQLMDPVLVEFAGGVSRLRQIMENSSVRAHMENGNKSVTRQSPALQFS